MCATCPRRSILADSQLLPQNFHHQTNGYLSDAPPPSTACRWKSVSTHGRIRCAAVCWRRLQRGLRALAAAPGQVAGAGCGHRPGRTLRQLRAALCLCFRRGPWILHAYLREATGCLSAPDELPNWCRAMPRPLPFAGRQLPAVQLHFPAAPKLPGEAAQNV